ncbi:MAG: PqqD family protein [Blautia sp.]|nr:PqqD family protein [Blautia sp.]
MKAAKGFILRNVVGEYILMPVDDKIAEFNGTVLMNKLSAFVWEKLQTSVSREEILGDILQEFEIDEATASKDLDELLAGMQELGILEADEC